MCRGGRLKPQSTLKYLQNLSTAILANLYWFSPPGSPFSTSEPSIEPEGQSSGGTEDNYHRNMSWLHVRLLKYFLSALLRVLVSTAASFQIMILLCNQQSFICTHVDFCHPRCYQHHSRSCARLVRAIKLVYGETVDSLREDGAISGHIMARAKKNKEVGLNWDSILS